MESFLRGLALVRINSWPSVVCFPPRLKALHLQTCRGGVACVVGLADEKRIRIWHRVNLFAAFPSAFEELPDEILNLIFDFLPRGEIPTRVCRRWRFIADSKRTRFAVRPFTRAAPPLSAVFRLLSRSPNVSSLSLSSAALESTWRELARYGLPRLFSRYFSRASSKNSLRNLQISALDLRHLLRNFHWPIGSVRYFLDVSGVNPKFLTAVNISFNPLADGDVATLCGALISKAPSLTDLDVSYTDLSDTGMCLLANCLSNRPSSLHSLSVASHRTFLVSSGTAAFARLLLSRPVHRLCISGGHYESDVAFSLVCEALAAAAVHRGASLRTLKAQFCRIEQTASMNRYTLTSNALLNAIEANPAITELLFSSPFFRCPNGWATYPYQSPPQQRRLKHALRKCTQLVNLSVKGNWLGTQGTFLCVESLRAHKFLKHLDLSWNKFSTDILLVLGILLPRWTFLETLDLTGVAPVADDERMPEVFLSSIRTHRSLRTVAFAHINKAQLFALHDSFQPSGKVSLMLGNPRDYTPELLKDAIVTCGATWCMWPDVHYERWEKYYPASWHLGRGKCWWLHKPFIYCSDDHSTISTEGTDKTDKADAPSPMAPAWVVSFGLLSDEFRSSMGADACKFAADQQKSYMPAAVLAA
mmetsp:Transcript_30624/g.49569  ORF Transcript_30624/g.49569 Transcript_30624/m.49569 type:complete len:646 (-) Transcript_30624:90-2027(-)